MGRRRYTVQQVMTDEGTLRVIREILKETKNPIGAYCIGIAHAVCAKAGVLPTRFLLSSVMRSGTVAEGVKITAEWIRGVREQRARDRKSNAHPC